MRRLACAMCESRVHRDVIGAHNIANAAQHQIRYFCRPDYLQPTDRQGKCCWTKGVKTSTPDPIKQLSPEQYDFLQQAMKDTSLQHIRPSPDPPDIFIASREEILAWRQNAARARGQSGFVHQQAVDSDVSALQNSGTINSASNSQQRNIRKRKNPATNVTETKTATSSSSNSSPRSTKRNKKNPATSVTETESATSSSSNTAPRSAKKIKNDSVTNTIETESATGSSSNRHRYENQHIPTRDKKQESTRNRMERAKASKRQISEPTASTNIGTDSGSTNTTKRRRVGHSGLPASSNGGSSTAPPVSMKASSQDPLLEDVVDVKSGRQ